MYQYNYNINKYKINYRFYNIINNICCHLITELSTTIKTKTKLVKTSPLGL